MEHVAHIRVSLPPVFDDDGTTVLQIAPIDVPLYLPMFEHKDARKLFDGKREVTANSFEITEVGLKFRFDKGSFTFRPERFEDAVRTAGLTLPLLGANALVGLGALQIATTALTRNRGQRGPGKAKMLMKDVLEVDVLARRSRGVSWREAARETLDAFAESFADLPDQSALIKSTQRALLKATSHPVI